MEAAPDDDRRLSHRLHLERSPSTSRAREILGIPNPFFYYQPSTFFLNMLPYALVILVLVIAAREANRKRIGAPAALGIPYVRGERGH